MQSSLLSFVLSGLGIDALKVAAAVTLAVLLALAFAVSSVAAVFGGYGPGPSSRTVSRPSQSLSTGASGSVVELAQAQIGVPYVWGGASPQSGFDCSGLVQWAYRQAGISLPRTAQKQFDATVRLAPSQLRPGDLVFFAQTYPAPNEWITHVGIYSGHGWMVNAPDRGDVVREMPVFTGFWGAHYAGAGRIGGRE